MYFVSSRVRLAARPRWQPGVGRPLVTVIINAVSEHHDEPASPAEPAPQPEPAAPDEAPPPPDLPAEPTYLERSRSEPDEAERR